MNIELKLAWRNLWRHPRRTWLTTGAMVFSNVLLVFMISLQFGMYRLMIDNSLRMFTGHLQVQAAGYKDDMRMRQVVPNAERLADDLRIRLASEAIAVRGAAFSLASSEDRSYGIQVFGVQPGFESRVSNLQGLVKSGRFLEEDDYDRIVIGSVLARNLPPWPYSTQLTPPLCAASRMTTRFEPTLQSRTTPSEYAAATVRPSGLGTAHRTSFILRPILARKARLSKSQRLSALSKPTVSRSFPSAVTEACRGWSARPSKYHSRPVAVSKTRAFSP